MLGASSSTSATTPSHAAPPRARTRPLLAALLAVLLAPTPAYGEPSPTTLDPEAKQHLERGLELYQAGDYPAAIEAFKAGYALDPRRDFLYAWAQAERLSGDCITATELYKRFISLSSSGMQVAAAEQGVELCARAIKEQRERAAQSEAEAEARAAAAQAERDAEARAQAEARAEAEARAAEQERARRFYLDPLGGALVGGGLALGLTGGALLTAAQVKQSQLVDAPTYGDFAANYDDVAGGARSLRIAGGALLGAGVVLIAGGVARWVIVRGGRGAAKGSAWISPQPAGVTFGGRF